MSEKHTPGPWVENGNSDWYPDRHEGQGDSSWVVIRSDTADIDVAIVMEQVSYWNAAETMEANALLIAAAPTMLGDLIEAERMFRWYGDMHAAKPDAEKAERNYAMADRLAATIALATPTSETAAGRDV